MLFVRTRSRFSPAGVGRVPLVAAVGVLAAAPVARGYVYWPNYSSGMIGRANLDGSDVNQRFITGAYLPIWMAVDSAHLYWINSGSGTIGRANLDGSSPKQNLIAGANDPCGVAVDGAHVYWANRGGDSIGRANLDGSSVDESFITGVDKPCGMAVDALAPATPGTGPPS